MSSEVNPDVTEIKAVSILEMSENGKGFGLNLEVVQEIFQSVENLPVAIISVCGALREGKSFILNLLLHYLLQQNKWHSNKNRKTCNVFKARNGTETETVGINITDKPIMLKDKNDKTVAVFLMDTEGLFDKERDAKECSTVFAMSCLLSSFQIYNVIRQLQESNLQHLQILCNYAMAAGGKKKKSATTDAPFQALMFLIRDWAHKNIDCSSTGAQRYLREFLETDKDENKLVRQQIKNSFSDVRCHVLPRPGDEVELKDGNEIYVSDISDKFVQGVDDLGEQLFKKENLIAKQLNGITITGQGFVDLTIAYAAILHDGKMPKADCILKANHQVFVLNRTRQIESEYIEAMKEKTGKYMKPNELEKLHQEYLHRALQQHQEMVKYMEPDKKDEEHLGTIQAHMMGRLNTTFQAMQHENDAKKKIQIKDIKEDIFKAGMSYKELLKRAADGVYLEDVSGPYKTAQKEILTNFYKSTHEYDQDIVQECMSFYNETIRAKQKEFSNKNRQRKESLEKSLKGLVSDTVEKYAEMMDLGVERPGQGIDFPKLKENAFAESIRIFVQSDVGKDYKCRQIELENLKAKLKENDAKYWERFCMYRDTELLKAVKEAEKLYKKYVTTELTQDTFLEEVELTSRHKKATAAAMVALKDIQYHRDEAFVQQCRESITEKLTDQLELMQKNNKLFQEKANARFKEGRREVVKVVFVKAFENKQEKYMEEDELQIIFQKLKEEAMQKYYLLKSPPEEEFKANEQELLHVIQNKIEEILACNNNNKEKIIDAIDTFYDLLLSDYGMKINEITRKRFVNEENLKKLHKKFKHLVVQNMVKAIPFKNIQQDAINKCSDGLDKKWKYWAEQSTMLKSFKENVKDGAAAGARVGAGFLGFMGAAIAGLAGGLVGGIAGVAKTAMNFKYDLSVEEMRSIKHLQSLNLAENVYDFPPPGYEF